MVTIYGFSKTTKIPIITLQSSNKQREINDKIEHLEIYYPELDIEVRH